MERQKERANKEGLINYVQLESWRARAYGAETRFKEMIWELKKNDENQQATRLKAQQIQNRVH